MPFLAYSPPVFLSAKTGHNLPGLFGALTEAHQSFSRRFDNEELTAFFWRAVQERPYTHNGKKLVFHGASQAPGAPPTFVLRTSLDPNDVHFSYERHLIRVFREAHGMAGSPLVLAFKRGRRGRGAA